MSFGWRMLRVYASKARHCVGHSTPHRSVHCSSTLHKKLPDDFDPEKPIQYSTSKAKQWSAIQSFSPPERKAPWYQPLSVWISSAIFLIYFLILREENDLDEEIGMSLYDRIPGLEEKQLKMRIQYEIEQGKDPSALKARLRELTG